MRKRAKKRPWEPWEDEVLYNHYETETDRELSERLARLGSRRIEASISHRRAVLDLKRDSRKVPIINMALDKISRELFGKIGIYYGGEHA